MNELINLFLALCGVICIAWIIVVLDYWRNP